MSPRLRTAALAAVAGVAIWASPAAAQVVGSSPFDGTPPEPGFVPNPSPLSLIGIEPVAPGEVVVRLRLVDVGGDVATAVAVGPEAASLPVTDGHRRASAEVRGLSVEGTGRLVVIAPREIRVPTAWNGPFCDRGGYTPISSAVSMGGGTVLHASGGGPVDLLVRVGLPLGFAGVPARLNIVASELVPDTGDDVLPLAASPAIVVDLPASPFPERRVTLAPVRYASRDRIRVKGQITPARAGVAVEFVGRRTREPTSSALYGAPVVAMPVGASLRRYGAATTDASGRFSAWLKVAPSSMVVARTPADAGAAHAGASCPLWVPPVKRRAKRR